MYSFFFEYQGQAVYKMTLPYRWMWFQQICFWINIFINPAFQSTNHIWVTSLQFMLSLCLQPGFGAGYLPVISLFKDKLCVGFGFLDRNCVTRWKTNVDPRICPAWNHSKDLYTQQLKSLFSFVPSQDHKKTFSIRHSTNMYNIS